MKLIGGVASERYFRRPDTGEWWQVEGRGRHDFPKTHNGQPNGTFPANGIRLTNAAGEEKWILANQGSSKLLVHKGGGTDPKA